MSINWTDKAERNRFPDGVVTNTISELTTDAGVTIDGTLIKDGTIETDDATMDTLLVDVINEKTAPTGVAIEGNILRDTTVTTNTLFTDLIEEKTTNAGTTLADGLNVDTINESTSSAMVSFPDDIKTDSISEITGSARVSFPDDIKVDQIQSFTPGGNILCNNALDVGGLRCNSISKFVSAIVINLGHTNSSNLTYFEDYTNPSALTDDTNSAGGIAINELRIQRFNNRCHLFFKFVATSTSFAFSDFIIPSRFRPVNRQTQRQMTGASASNPFLYIQVDGSKLRLGKHNFSGSLVNYTSSETLVGNITYFLV